MTPDVPDFASQLDPNAFKVPGAQQLADHLGQAGSDTQGINFDWSQTHALLGQLASGQGFADQRASGKGLTAGAETAMGQQDLGASSGSPADLGKALMRLGSKASTGQAMQQASAQGQQQGQAMDAASQLREAQAAARIHIYKQELALQDQKFQIGRAVQQSKDGLDLANLQMRNMFNAAVSGAKNSTDLASLQKQHQDFSQIMQYLGAGVGTAASLTSAGAAAAGAAAQTDNSYDGDIDLAKQGANQYGGLTTSTNYRSSGFTPAQTQAPAMFSFFGNGNEAA